MMNAEEFEKRLIQGMNATLLQNEETKQYHADIIYQYDQKRIGLFNCSREEFLEKMKRHQVYGITSLILNDLYVLYQKHRSMHEVIERSIDVLLSGEMEFDCSSLLDYSYVKKHMLMNFENRCNAYRKPVNFVRYSFYDICGYIQVQIMRGNKEIRIDLTHDIFEKFDISSERLQYDAMLSSMNYQRLVIFKWSEIAETMNRYTYTEPVHIEHPDSVLVVSDSDFKTGSIYMFFQPILQALAERCKGNFYILPSSKEELIIIPAYLHYSSSYLYELLEDFNMQNDSDTKLSDYVFYYDAGKKELNAVKNQTNLNYS